MVTERLRTDNEALSRFLMIDDFSGYIDLCLPVFESVGGAAMVGQAKRETYRYPSETLATRDVRSAFHIQLLLNSEVEQSRIEMRSPDEFLQRLTGDHGERVGFLFGSRSNRALKGSALEMKLNRLIRFEFGQRWTIIGEDGERFSIKNPSKSTEEEYAASDDFAAIARVRGDHPRPIFFVAGLGGRATEGAGYFLRHHWAGLSGVVDDRDFAVILKFDAPVEPERARLVKTYLG